MYELNKTKTTINRSSTFSWFSSKLELAHGNHTKMTSMEGLRGIAVFLVFLVHFISLHPGLCDKYILSTHSFIQYIGNAGVDLFFVLSGFLIYGAVIKKETPFIPYAKRRIQRIYPAFLAVFMFYIVVSIFVVKNNSLPTETGPLIIYIIQNLLLLPGVFDIKPLVTVSWSLSYEALYYILIPLVITIFKIRSKKTMFRLILWSLVMAFGLTSWWFIGGEKSHSLSFIAGIILYEALSVKALSVPKHVALVVLPLTLLVYGALHFFKFGGIVVQVAVLSVGFFFVCYDLFSNTYSKNIFTWTPLRWLGNMSYSYYLWHGVALNASFMIISKLNIRYEAISTLSLGCLMFIVTLALSFVMFLLVEVPFSLKSRHNTKTKA